MYRTRVDVDRHVQELFAKTKSAHERHLKCYNIARLYYKVGAYAAAKRHVLMYLSANENSVSAHQLLGDCHEKLNEINRAIADYKRSLELDSEQPGLILKMCDLMGQLSLSNLDIGKARYWCEKGSNFFPNDPVISKLKQKILITENKDPKALEDFYLAESKNRPNDSNILIQLLTLYMDSGRSIEAYEKAMEFEERVAFRTSIEWYRCLSRICATCREESECRSFAPDLLKNSIIIYDRFLFLLHPASNVQFEESVSVLHFLDQILFDANKTLNLNDQFDNAFMSHYSAQLGFHVALILLKRATQENLTWCEAVRCASPPLLFSLAGPFAFDASFSHDPKYHKTVKGFIDDTNYRIVQATMTLLNWSKGSKLEDFIGKILHYFSKNYREHIYSRVFLKQTQRKDAGTSYWQNSNSYVKLPTKIPDLDKILTKPILLSYELHNPNSLHNMIWLGLQIILLNKPSKQKLILPIQLNCQTLTKFPFTHSNLSTSNIETLSKLDIDTFLYLAILSNHQLTEDQIASSAFAKDQPNTLPADIVSSLQTEEQAKFWTAVCKLEANELNDKLGDFRSVLVQGIEVVRLIGNHGLDIQTIVSVARIFESHAKCASKEQVVAYESRALLYWSKAVKILELFEKRSFIAPAKNRNKFFENQTSNYSAVLSSSEITSLLEEGRLFIACDFMKKEEYEKAMNAFKLLRSPYASFNQALIFKKLAFNEINFSINEEVTSTMRSKHIILLTKARDALYLTQERIRSDFDHPLHATLKVELDSLENQLARLDPESVCAHVDDAEADVSISSIGSLTGDNIPIHYTPKYDPAHVSHSFVAPGTPLFFDLSRPFSAEKVSSVNTSLSTFDRTEIKQLTSLHSKTLSLVEELCKRIEKIETDINSIKKTTKKNDRNVEEILAKVYSKSTNTTVSEELYVPQEELDDYVDEVNYTPYANYRAASAFPMPTSSQHQPLYQSNIPAASFPAQAIPPIIPSPYFPAGVPTNSPLFPSQPGQPLAPFFAASGALPFSEGQKLPDFLNTSKLNALNMYSQTLPIEQPIIPDQPLHASSKEALPNNVVITKSDTLPTGSPPIQPPLSVTIPPQHLNSGRLKQAPPSHSFHIPLPSAESTPLKLSGLNLESTKVPISQTVSPGSISVPSTVSKINVGGLTFSSEPIIKTVETEDKVVKETKAAQNAPPNPFAYLSLKTAIPSPTHESLTQMFSSANIFGAKSEITAQPVSVSTASVGDTSTSVETRPSGTGTLAKPETDSFLKSILKDTSACQQPESQKHVEFLFNSDATVPILGKTSLDFAAIAANATGESPFKSSPAFKGFEGQGSKLFGTESSPVGKPTSPVTSSENAEDFVPTAEFKPVIALPDVIEVKTGEEDLTVLYEERCKLLRFDAENKEWKERGLGKMKLLLDPKTNAVRLLMRREQVLKVCCNQRLTEGLILHPVASSDKAWSWCGQDFSEEEGRPETFAIRFKSAELAKVFFDAVESAKKIIVKKKESDEKSTASDSESKSAESVNGIAKNNKNVPLSELFKPKTGSWECTDCYTRNDADKMSCLACGNNNPNAPADAFPVVTSPFKLGLESPLTVTGSTSGFTFGIPKSAATETVTSSITSIPTTHVTSGFTFGINPGKTEVKPNFSFSLPPTTSTISDSSNLFSSKTTAIASSTSKPSVTVSAEPITSSANQTVQFVKTDSNQVQMNGETSLFGMNGKEFQPSLSSKSPFNFSDSGNNLDGSKTGGFQFGSGNAKGFNFSGVRLIKSPRSPGTRHSESEPENDEVSEADESNDNIYFQPVVPLPDKIIPKTGEEDEIVLYSHLAKLYRYRDSEWKERGTGDIKLLRHNVTSKLRFVMRRKPVEALCLNHYLTPDIKITPKDKRSWTWTAQDFSDYNEFDRKSGAECKPEVFSLRFKNEEIAQGFKAAVDAALSGESVNTSAEANKSSSDDDCQIIWDSRTQPISDVDRKTANDLKLPAHFYNYKTAPPCPGCVGCDDDDEPEKSAESVSKTNDEKASDVVTNGGPQTPSPSVLSTPGSISSSGTPINTSSPFSNSPSSLNRSVASNPGKLFNGSSFTNDPNTTPVSSIFGGSGGGNKKISLLGDNNQTPPAEEKSVSIFGGSGQKTSFFGSLAQNSQPVLGSSNNQTPLFGSSNTTNSFFDSSNKGNSIFTSSNNENLSQVSVEQPSFFGASSNVFSSSFSSSSETKTDSAISKDANPVPSTADVDSAFVLKTSGISFASLAAKPTTFGSTVAEMKPFSFQGSGSSVFSGAGSSVFGSVTSTNESPNKSSPTNGDDDGNETYEDNDHDPHYEPIVPLPDRIVVRTGEEDEEKLFVERAKVFRYENDNKEWKERGVGEMKVLKNPSSLTYRLLLRRDKIHKVVCNVRLTENFELNPLSLSPNALMFITHNLAEDYKEPELEKLAVRFKNEEIMNAFKDTVNKCVEEIRSLKINSSLVESTYEDANETVSDEENNYNEEYSEGEEEEGEEEEVGEEGEEGEVGEEGEEEVEDYKYEEEQGCYYYDERNVEGRDEIESIIFSSSATVFSREANKKSNWELVGDGSLSIYSSYPCWKVKLITKSPKDSIIMKKGVLVFSDASIDRKGLTVVWSGSGNSENQTEESKIEYMSKFTSKDAATEFFTVYTEAKEIAAQQEAE